MASASEQIRAARIARGLTQSELAARAGISRQALGAIEAGHYQPGVAVAIALARALGESVETLFGAESSDEVSVRVPGGINLNRGARVRLVQIGGRVVVLPAASVRNDLAPADGLISRKNGSRASVTSYVSREEISASLVVAGCDPAAALLADFVQQRHAPVRIIAMQCGSHHALDAILAGRAHIAGVHLRDARSGEYNLGAVRRTLRHRSIAMVHFASWELGLATAAGNPLAIRGFEDLVRPRLRIVNRERGSGARIALDDAMTAMRLRSAALAGYDREAGGHLEVAAAVAAGEADLGVTIRVAANAYELGFVPIREERYDLAIPQGELTTVPVRAMLDAMNSRRFAGAVAGLCGYDTREMGEMGPIAAPA